MTTAAARVQRVYLLLTLLSTLAASLIWGVNTLFLLDAGLSNTQAFTANAFYTVGQVLFELPTGIIADTRGRRASYLYGAGTLLISTLLYLLMWRIQAPLWAWALSSITIGLGFTFFSGAVEAWLVDALNAAGFDGAVEDIFARGQVVAGAAMLVGSVSGGYLAQATNLGAPYIVRAGLLGLTLVVAAVTMHDLGFSPHRDKSIGTEIRTLVKASIDSGWRNPPVRWMMLGAPFTFGASVFAFYALQPYLLELYGDPTAFGVAGLAAAIVAGAQILGGVLVSTIRKRFQTRTGLMTVGLIISTSGIGLIAVANSFWLALVGISLWGLVFSIMSPVRQAYVNGLIPSEQRATVLSFDALLGSAGGAVAQPLLGRSADVFGYSTAYLFTAGVQVLALPFFWLARRENADSDPIVVAEH